MTGRKPPNLSKPKCRRCQVNLARPVPNRLCRRCYQDNGPFGYVDGTEVAAHLEKLHRMGIPWQGMADMLGMTRAGLLRIRNNPTRVQRATADRVLAIPMPVRPVHGNNIALVPALGARRRIGALMAIGHTKRAIAEVAGGMNPTNLGRAFVSPVISSATAKAINLAYQQMQMTQGPTTAGGYRARKWAEQNGYPPPFCWDDNIDDPDATPILLSDSRVSFAEKVAEYRSIGYSSDDDLAKAMGIQVDSVQSQLRRARIPLGTRYRDVEDHREISKALY